MCFWKSPLSNINIFRGILTLVWNCSKFKQWQNKFNKIKQNRNKRTETYLGLPGAHLPGPARPSPSPLPPCRLPLPVGRGEAWRAPERPRPPPASPGHLLLPLVALDPVRDATHPPRPRTLPVPSPPLLWLPLSPNAPAAADENHRSHRPPHASSKRQEAPPRPPLPPHQDGRRRKPWMGPASPFPSSATADRRRQIRPHPASLKLAVHLYRVYVSSPSVSPSLFRRSRAVARLSTKADTPPPPAMPPPSL